MANTLVKLPLTKHPVQPSQSTTRGTPRARVLARKPSASHHQRQHNPVSAVRSTSSAAIEQPRRRLAGGEGGRGTVGVPSLCLQCCVLPQLETLMPCQPVLTDSAMRPTAFTACRAVSGLMSRVYSVSSPTMSYTLDALAISVRISILSCFTYLQVSNSRREKRGGTISRS